ncbi:MAG: DsrE family protein [Dehalococcoidia bacterium]|nr:DsrE family protein [Dehalococcoidia bacterium]
MNESLAVVWVSRDKEAAMNMVFMYAKNSLLKNWWAKVSLIIWGPSGPLLVGDAELQKELKALKKAGVELLACKACADRYGISSALSDLGVDVKYMGEPLTQLLKSGTSVLTV